MRGRILWIGLTLLASALVLEGCAFLINTHVNDVRLVGVSLVKAGDVLHSPAAFSPQGDRKVLLVSVETAHDMGFAAFDGKFPLDAEVKFCSGAGMIAWSALSYAGIRLGDFGGASPDRERFHDMVAIHTSDHPYVYQLWFDYQKLPGHQVVGADYVPYDMLGNPQDLCVVMGGTPYMAVGTGLVTNVVVIPKQAIVEALKTGMR